MNQALENLLSRRSIRSYEKRQIDPQLLEQVLQAGVYAPTAKGMQSPLIVVVQDAGTVAAMSRLNAKVLGREDTDPFYGAPTVILVLRDKANPNGMQDASLVMGNLLNAAHAVGLGACWINRAREAFETPEGRELLKTWGVPEGYEGVGNCILGYALGEYPTPIPRKDGYIIRT